MFLVTAKNRSFPLMTSHRAVDAQVLEERDHPGQDLGHAASDGRGVDVLDGLAREPFRQEPEFLDGSASGHRSIVFNPGHDAPPIRTIFWRRPSSVIV